LDTDWIKAAAAQVRTTIRQAANRVNRLGNSKAGGARREALDDAPGTRTLPKGKNPGADSK